MQGDSAGLAPWDFSQPRLFGFCGLRLFSDLLTYLSVCRFLLPPATFRYTDDDIVCVFLRSLCVALPALELAI